MQSTTKIKKSNNEHITSHGRRKTSVARVSLYKGKGDFIVNQKPIEEYFPSEVDKVRWQKPFVLTKSIGQYHASVKVEGSGKSSQLDAIAHGLSRALIKDNPDFRPTLKKARLLTRDPRAKERRKFGRAQKARKGKQSPKR